MGLKGQDRTPGQPVRARRNFDHLAGDVPWISADEVIALTGDGILTLTLKSDGGLENDAGELAINLDSTPGLVLAAGGIKVLLDPSEPGLQLTSGLKVLLATDPGLEFSSGVRVKLNGTTLTRAAAGLSVTNPEGIWSVTAVKTSAHTAAIGELVRCDPSGGAFTVTLPTAASVSGQKIVIKNVTTSTNIITLDGDGSETIDGSLTVLMSVGYQALTLCSDGTNWMII